MNAALMLLLWRMGVQDIQLTSDVPFDASFRGTGKGRLHTHATQRKLGTKATDRFHYEDQESSATE